MNKMFLLPLIVLSLIVFSGCADPRAQVKQIAEIRGAAEAAAQWPDLPEDCRVLLSERGQVGERLDTAWLRLRAKLAAQDARITRCADWYDAQKDYRAKLAERIK